ncbi:hypothetical protein A9Q90_05150 [Gammaproteobacteria bacterium 54_18_T64]|nr:hypothetical protein A9Q90_05150 [Gammaproteobacteria bacterium 54_18_T64]
MFLQVGFILFLSDNILGFDNTLMYQNRQNKFRWLLFVLLLVLTLGGGYRHYRQEVFEVFAAGTEWVLVTCGFQPAEEAERSESLQSDQLRRLFYAARMFNSPPPAELSAEDARADKKYPGVGFGLLHTFNTKAVPMVIGGWLYSIPCTYFADARDCQSSGGAVARLKVSAAGLSAMTEDNIETFLAAGSVDIAVITIAGLEGRAQQWWRQAPLPSGYSVYEPSDFSGGSGALLCTQPQAKSAVMAHCLLRFMHGGDVYVELKFASQRRDNWARIQQQARALIRGFQVKR